MKTKFNSLKGFSLGKKLFLSFLLTLFFITASAQNTGDFRSRASGNWISSSTWEVYNGSTWVDATTTYPGSVAGNYGATISACHIVSTSNSASSFKIGDLTISGVLMINGTLNLLTTDKLWINGGSMVWADKVGVHLPNNSALIITGPKLCTNNYDLGLSSTSNSSCNANTALYIGSVKYTSCVGKGSSAVGDFDMVNGLGGSLLASPGASPVALCLGSTVLPVLYGNAVQYGTNLGTITYTWSLVSKPAASNLLFPLTTTRNPTLPILAVAGEYIFKLVTSIPLPFSNEQLVVITVGGESIYSGGIWSADIPSASNQRAAKISENYSTAVGGSFEACSCEVVPTKTLTVSKDTYVKIQDNILNNGTIIIASDANLIQTNPAGAYTGTGVFKVERSVTNMRYNPGSNPGVNAVDYVYWSAPVTGQNIRSFSPGTPATEILQYNEATDYFVASPDATFQKGKGYAIRAEGTSPTPTGYNKTYEFIGIPNNGDILVPIKRSPDSGGEVHGYNLVGNPYPSNINFDQLFANNAALIHNTAWFWKNNSYAASQQGQGYSGNNYMVYNGTGGSNSSMNGIVKVGQGFLVQKKEVGPANLSFKNSYGVSKDLRVSTPGTFYQRSSESKNRFWLKLISPNDEDNTQLIGYIEGATNGFETDYDAEIFGLSSNIFYSILEDKQLVIQGKSPQFSTNDRIDLGANFFANGSYTIELEEPQGIFSNGQSIYLKDKFTGTITNLSQGSYTFTANKGETNTRFEIMYKPETVLLTDNKVKEAVVVYREASNFVVKSPKNIETVEAYDLSGKLITVLKANSNLAVLNASFFNKGMYVLRIKTTDGEITNKKIVKQ